MLNPYTDPLSEYNVLKGLTQPILLFIPYMGPRNPLHWSPVSIQGVWNNPYCCFNKQLLFDAVLLFFDMTSDLIMYLFTCHTDYNYYVIFSKSMLQYDMMRELSTLCYNDINIHIYCGKLKEFWSSQGTLTMISL